MNPYRETKRVLKSHLVKELAEGVQKFYNGPSCAIMIEDTKNLSEVISMLKKLVVKN